MPVFNRSKKRAVAVNTKIMVRNQFYTFMPILYWLSLFFTPILVTGWLSDVTGHIGWLMLVFLGSLIISWLLGIISYGLIFSFLDMADRVESIERRLRKAEKDDSRPPSPEPALEEPESRNKSSWEGLI